MKGKEVQEQQSCHIHGGGDISVVIVPGVEKGEEVEQENKEHELGDGASRDGNLSTPEELNRIDRCHQANAHLHQDRLGSVKGIVQDSGQDKDRDKEG